MAFCLYGNEHPPLELRGFHSQLGWTRRKKRNKSGLFSPAKIIRWKVWGGSCVLWWIAQKEEDEEKEEAYR